MSILNELLDQRATENELASRRLRKMRSWWYDASYEERAEAGVPGRDLGEDVNPVQFMQAAERMFPDG